MPKAQHTLSELKDAGYDTILELTVCGLGRDIALMQQAVQGSGLQVIVSTGLYTYDVLPALRERGVTDEQVDQMLRATPMDFFER